MDTLLLVRWLARDTASARMVKGGGRLGVEKDPLVSVVIPCWNADRYVRDAIESALSQSYPNIEVVVVDDGSTDDTAKVVESFGSLVRFRTIENGGGARARNEGIRIAGGRFVQFLDADDLLDVLKVERQMSIVGSYDMTFCRGRIRTLSGKEVGRVGIRHEQDPFRSICLDLYQTASPIIRKSCLEAIGGFREKLRRGQERDLFLRLALAGATWNFSELELFTVRKVADSLSSNLEWSLGAYEEVFHDAYIKSEGARGLTGSQVLALADAMVQGAAYYASIGCKQKAKRYYKIAKSMHVDAGSHMSTKRKIARKVLGFYWGTLLTQNIKRFSQYAKGRTVGQSL